MFYYASAFVIVALFAAVLGFGSTAGIVALAGKVLFWIFTATLVTSLLAPRRQRAQL